MAHAFHPAVRALVAVAVLSAAHPLAAAAPRDGERRAGTSIVMMTAATPPKAAAANPANGVGVGPARPVVTNPYSVPLFQNAGQLRISR